jgi:hypothetical protein
LLICTHTQKERSQNHGEKGTGTINDLVDTHCEDEFVYGVIVGELHKAEAFLLSCKETRSSPMNAFNVTVGKVRFISIKSTYEERRKPKNKKSRRIVTGTKRKE